MTKYNDQNIHIYTWTRNYQVKGSHRGLTRINSSALSPVSRRGSPLVREEIGEEERGDDFSRAEKDKGSAFIARERFPYFLLVALVRPAIDKANPLSPLLATLTLVHPLCTLLFVRPRKRFEPRNALSLFVHEVVVSLRRSLAVNPIDPTIRRCLQLAEEFARLMLRLITLEFLPVRANRMKVIRAFQ